MHSRNIESTWYRGFRAYAPIVQSIFRARLKYLSILISFVARHFFFEKKKKKIFVQKLEMKLDFWINVETRGRNFAKNLKLETLKNPKCFFFFFFDFLFSDPLSLFRPRIPIFRIFRILRTIIIILSVCKIKTCFFLLLSKNQLMIDLKRSKFSPDFLIKLIVRWRVSKLERRDSIETILQLYQKFEYYYQTRKKIH